MISVSQAKLLIDQNIEALPLHSVPLAMVSGQVLAEDIYASMDIPAFEQSSMDGYAIRFEDKEQALTLHGEMQAGATAPFTLLTGYAARIFTGAPLPTGADTVVMQEKVLLNGSVLTVEDAALTRGLNVRNKGAEAKSGALAITKGSRLTPAAIGYLAGLGKTEAKVHKIPTVGIIATGKELQSPGTALQFGQVYESNSFTLAAALERALVTQINFYTADDDLDELTSILKDALSNNDLVLLTGGVSVGDYDFVLAAAENLSITQIFHKVKQKPGKPLYFGKKENKVIFGLPGNPSSVLSCFYQYVLPALEKLTGHSSRSLKTVNAKLTHSFSKPAGLTHFLKAHYGDLKVTPLNAQESFRMSSFAQANCMIEIPEEEFTIAAGNMVKVHLFPE